MKFLAIIAFAFFISGMCIVSKSDIGFSTFMICSLICGVGGFIILKLRNNN